MIMIIKSSGVYDNINNVFDNDSNIDIDSDNNNHNIIIIHRRSGCERRWRAWSTASSSTQCNNNIGKI